MKAIDSIIQIIPQRGLIENDNKILQELVKLIGASKMDQYVPKDELVNKIKSEFKRILDSDWSQKTKVIQ